MKNAITIIRGTKAGFNRQLEARLANGWQLVEARTVPRGNTGKFVYIADLQRKEA